MCGIGAWGGALGAPTRGAVSRKPTEGEKNLRLAPDAKISAPDSNQPVIARSEATWQSVLLYTARKHTTVHKKTDSHDQFANWSRNDRGGLYMAFPFT